MHSAGRDYEDDDDDDAMQSKSGTPLTTLEKSELPNKP